MQVNSKALTFLHGAFQFGAPDCLNYESGYESCHFQPVCRAIYAVLKAVDPVVGGPLASIRVMSKLER